MNDLTASALCSVKQQFEDETFSEVFAIFSDTFSAVQDILLNS